jgi:hypothetical protein
MWYVLLVVSTLLALAVPLQAQVIPFLPNFGCVQWHITGPCVCWPNTACVLVSYWEPAYLIETVKHPGNTTVAGLQGILNQVLAVAGIPTWGGGGAGNASGSGQTNLQYNETHVFTFPNLWSAPCSGCGATNLAMPLHYASELDPRWRTAAAPMTLLARLPPLGVWAPLFPRGGKAIHSSEPVGSGIAAARGLDIAFRPVGPPPHLDAHVVLQRTQGTSTCCQLAQPRKTGCFPVGTPPNLWEHASVSPQGSYTWIFWRKRTCCVSPEQSHCGLTWFGGQGANTCGF